MNNMGGVLYKENALNRSSLLQRLFRQVPEENAVIEINNLLAKKPVKEIDITEVKEIEKKYKISLIGSFKLNMEEFYAVYLNYCLSDKELSAEELSELDHLGKILGLDKASVNRLHVSLGESIYRQSFRETIADGRLTENEKLFLKKLENTLMLPRELAERISEQVRSAHIEQYVKHVIADQRLSPSEEKELEAMCCSLEVNLVLNEKTKTQLKKLKVYWALENLPLPVEETDIVLQKSEQCHLCIPSVKWYELRTIKHRVGYSGYSGSIKIAKGFYLRSGSYKSHTYSTDEMTLIDKGTLYLTNKRIIFTGNKKNTNIRLDKILLFEPYSDGVEIQKDTGKSPTLQLPWSADVFCIMLERLLNER